MVWPVPPREVPAYIPGEHPFRDEFAKRHNLPEIAVRGGAETMYPEFQAKVREALAAAQKAPASQGQRPAAQGQGR